MVEKASKVQCAVNELEKGGDQQMEVNGGEEQNGQSKEIREEPIDIGENQITQKPIEKAVFAKLVSWLLY